MLSPSEGEKKEPKAAAVSQQTELCVGKTHFVHKARFSQIQVLFIPQVKLNWFLFVEENEPPCFWVCPSSKVVNTYETKTVI